VAVETGSQVESEEALAEDEDLVVAETDTAALRAAKAEFAD
tara:strand:- start:81 stop:203 length:123 start_codon:yes stop_codon:yes gene_type:complete